MIKLVKSSFYNEANTKKSLLDFIAGAPMFSMGAECAEFEKRFAEKQGRKFAVFVSSGSMANLVLIQALLNLGRLKKADRIGFSALTWATNVMPLIQLGLAPKALDCELSTLNLSSEILEKEIAGLDALFLTNVLGFCDDLSGIEKICEKHNIILLEDNCESLGSKSGGKLLGNFGLASTFSFFVGHHLSTIEGGMICTDDEELYNMLLMTRAHGWDRNLPETAQKKIRSKNNIEDFYGKYTFYDLAYNARPTEIQGALGNAQIGFWDEIVAARQNNFGQYRQAMEGNNDLILPDVSHMQIVSNFDMPVIAKTKALFKKYLGRFVENQIEIRPIIAGDITKQPFYVKYCGPAAPCPNSAFIHDCGFYFPNNAELTAEEVNLMCGLLKQ